MVMVGIYPKKRLNFLLVAASVLAQAIFWVAHPPADRHHRAAASQVDDPAPTLAVAIAGLTSADPCRRAV